MAVSPLRAASVLLLQCAACHREPSNIASRLFGIGLIVPAPRRRRAAETEHRAHGAPVA